MNRLGFFLLKPFYSIDIILNMTLENKNEFILFMIRKNMTVTYDWSNINFKKIS